ncbi:DUF4430 domain-containing protein [Candidatus Berkelbacteria bacterium]|nr:DUF4430 domain-containing protein [Candidatus Berkelbacteria bacterium]
MKKSHKVVLIAIIIIVSLGLVSNFSGFASNSGARRQQPRNVKSRNDIQRQEPTTADLKVARAADNKTVSYQGLENKTALELLRLVAHVETKNFGELGDMVTEIDGIAADNGHFWALYVNGKQSEVGASTYKTKTGEQVEWRYEAIK